MFYFMNVVRPSMNYAIFCELCDWMRFEVDCAKSHHHVIPEGLPKRDIKESEYLITCLLIGCD